MALMACAWPRRGTSRRHDGEDRPLGFHGGIGGLIDDASHLAIAFRAAVTVVHFRTLLVAGATESVPRRITQGRELSWFSQRERHDAQLFGQSRTLGIKQLLGLDGSMANLDLAAPSAAFCPTPRIFISFRGPLQAQLQPVAEIVQCGEPISSFAPIREYVERLM